ncbi:hypothetical protein, partial [Mesorhizobium sp.]|uniref:hypothetical protein n=1 Tax=Mesorhizobium sp. TaxID=1871066 RepID=UPI0025D9348C
EVPLAAQPRWNRSLDRGKDHIPAARRKRPTTHAPADQTISAAMGDQCLNSKHRRSLKKLPPHGGGGKVSSQIPSQDDQDRRDEAKGGNLILQR